MTDKSKVWIVDDDKSIRWVLEKALSRENVDITSFSQPDQVLARIQHETPDVVISDIRMPGMDGITLLEKIKQHAPDLPVIIMTAYSDLDRAVSAFREGAFEYLSKPFDVDEVVSLVKRAVRENSQEKNLATESPAGNVDDIIGSAPAISTIRRSTTRR